MAEAQRELVRQGQDDPASLTLDEIRELSLVLLEQLGYGLQVELEPEQEN